MLQPHDIEKIMQLLTSRLKAAAGMVKRKTDNPAHDETYRRVAWSPLYTEATAHSREIEVHASGQFPKNLLYHTFPNETEDEKNYRQKTFQPITEPYWKKAIRSLNRVWSEQNYSVKWGTNEDAQTYFTQQLPLYQNVFSYFKQVVTTTKINDPNAVLTVSFNLPVKEQAEGEWIIDDSTPLNPYPAIYACHDVLLYESNALALFMSAEKAEVEYAGKKQATGYVLYLYDTENIYRIEQCGKKIDWQFQATLYYHHRLGYLPCFKLKGTPEAVLQSEILYDSHFSPAIPHLNEAIIIHSTLKASISKIAYPIRAYYEQSCSNHACNGGLVYDDSLKENIRCSTCGGSGKLKFSPLRDYVHEAPTLTNNAGNDQIPFPGMAYISPDSAILDFSKATINEWIQQAFLFLNIDAAPDGMKTGLGSNATATKTKIDREEQFVSMLDISNELFDLLHRFIDAAYTLRYLQPSPVVISAPKTFELISAWELTDEIGNAKTTALPDVALAELTTDYVLKRFSQKGDLARMTRIAQYTDALFTKSPADLAQLSAYIQPWEATLHLFIYTFISEQLEQDPTFLNRKDSEIKAVLVEMAKAKAGEQKAV